MTQPADPIAEKSPVSPSTGPRLSDLFDFGTLKALGNFLGIAGVAGGGFAALCFGIGYLAVKNQDEMMGIPTTSMTSSTYVRTGAIFFPNFIHNTVVALMVPCLWIVAVLMVFWICLSLFRMSRLFGRLSNIINNSRMLIPMFHAVHLPVLGLGIYILVLQIASFDPINKDLLQRAVSPAARIPVGMEASTPGSLHTIDSISDYKAQLADRINRNLRKEDGAGWLQNLFGRESALLLVFVYAVVMIWRWRRSLKERSAGPGTGARPFLLIDWAVHPILIVIMVALLINLPATYGVLCLSRQRAWVKLNDEARGGYLLSDLTTEPQEIWVLGNEKDKWKLRAYKRDDLRSIKMTSQYTMNILAFTALGQDSL